MEEGGDQPVEDRCQAPRRLRKAERRERILTELRLKPHVRIAELAELFGVTTETVRRDVEELSHLGKLSRAYGGASATHPGAYPGLDVRRRAHLHERERIGRRAAALVMAGETVMIDAGSTTAQCARFLALAGTPLTAITNSVHVALTLGHTPSAKVILCPGDFLAQEGAVIGSATVEHLSRHHVDRTFIGASALSVRGVTEAVTGFGEIKRAMLRQARTAHLLIDSSKFGATHLSHVAECGAFASIVTDRPPDGELAELAAALQVELLVAG